MTAPAVTSVRAGDRDREQTAGQLGQALSQGYLAIDEYENRLQATFAAHTTTELRQLVADLPLAQLRRNDPQRQAAPQRAARLGVRIHLGAYLAMVVIVLTVWLVVGLTSGRLVLLADLADPRRGHRRRRSRTTDSLRRPRSVPASRLDQSRPDRVARQREAVTQAEFGQRVRPVPVDGLGADPQRRRDLPR